MKIALVFGPNDKEAVLSLLKDFHEKELEASAFQIGNHWETAGQELAEQLDKASHTVVVATASSCLSPWFPFVTGYCVGKERRGLFYSPRKTHIPEPYGMLLQIFHDQETLGRFFDEEKKVWHEGERKNDARNELVESGLGLTSENFASCVVAGDCKGAENFLVLGFSPDTENGKGVPVLVLAVRGKHAPIVRSLIAHGAEVNRLSADRGNTALMDAAVAGEISLVEALIEAGADPNIRSKNGQTALMLAVGEGRTAVVKVLLRNGADPSATDNLGMTARKYAELFKQSAILDLLNTGSKENANGSEGTSR